MSARRERGHRSGLSRKAMPPIGEAAGSTDRAERMGDAGGLDVGGLDRLDSLSEEEVARICSNVGVDLTSLGHAIWEAIPDMDSPPAVLAPVMRNWAEWSCLLTTEQVKALLTTYAALQVLRVMLTDE